LLESSSTDKLPTPFECGTYTNHIAIALHHRRRIREVLLCHIGWAKPVSEYASDRRESNGSESA
jgi:hypothetical protein